MLEIKGSAQVNSLLGVESMKPDLKPSEPLSQVVFIHDYIQLVFQEVRFSIYNVSELVDHGSSLRTGQPGFCDALVALIGQRVTSVSTQEPEILFLRFERGAYFRVLGDEESIRGADPFDFYVESHA